MTTTMNTVVDDQQLLTRLQRYARCDGRLYIEPRGTIEMVPLCVVSDLVATLGVGDDPEDVLDALDGRVAGGTLLCRWWGGSLLSAMAWDEPIRDGLSRLPEVPADTPPEPIPGWYVYGF